MKLLVRSAAVLLALFMGFVLCSCRKEPAETAVLVYMIGSDLETERGCATSDIEELCQAQLDGLPVLLQTGGARQWHREGLEGGTIQRFCIGQGECRELSRMKAVSMADPKTLTDFLRWGKKTCPARRYIVLFWDHGGGTALGFGCDELFPCDTLSLSEFHTAFEEADFHADLVGFDACLMGTLETAAAFADHADLLVASEETEPEEGWYYTDWLNELARQPDMDLRELARRMTEDYFTHAPQEERVTLSALDLSRTQETVQMLNDWLRACKKELSQRYAALSMARSTALELGEHSYDQADLLSILHAADAPQELCRQVEKMVLCSVSDLPDSCGLAIYSPFRWLDYYSVMRRELPEIYGGFGQTVSFYDDVLSVAAYAHQLGDGPSIPAQLTGYPDEDFSTDLTEEAWYSFPAAASCFDSELSVPLHHPMTLIGAEGGVLLAQDQLDGLPVAEARLEVCAKIGSEYLQFGVLPVERRQEGLFGSFDGRWLSLENGQLVPFFALFDDEEGVGGYALATLDRGDDIRLMIQWTGDTAQVKGYRLTGEEEEEEMAFPTRGLSQLKPGEKLDFFCPSTSDTGYSNATCYVGDTVTVGEEGLALSVLPMSGGQETYLGLRLTDIYRCHGWTKPMCSADAVS